MKTNQDLRMDEIESQCADLLSAQVARKMIAGRIRSAHRKVMENNIEALKSAIAEESVKHESLVENIQENKDLFTKPKTRAFMGVKVGFRKKPGKVVIKDPKQALLLAKKFLLKEHPDLIVTTERLDLTQIKKLSVKEMGKIGATYIDSTDEAFAQTAKTDPDKLIDALMSEFGKLMNEEE